MDKNEDCRYLIIYDSTGNVIQVNVSLNLLQRRGQVTSLYSYLSTSINWS